MNRSLRPSLGVTLIEMLVGVAVLGVVLAVAIPSLTSFVERRRVVAAAGEVASLFTFAKSEANIVADTVNLHMEPVPANIGQYSCIRVSTFGAVDSCRCDLSAACGFGSSRLLREYVLQYDSSVRFTGSATRGGTAQYVVSFARDTHFTDLSDVQVTVTGTRTQAQLRVEYNNAGRVRICAPNSDFSGYPACA